MTAAGTVVVESYGLEEPVAVEVVMVAVAVVTGNGKETEFEVKIETLAMGTGTVNGPSAGGWIKGNDTKGPPRLLDPRKLHHPYGKAKSPPPIRLCLYLQEGRLIGCPAFERCPIGRLLKSYRGSILIKRPIPYVNRPMGIVSPMRSRLKT